jgi:hypothetical protein
VTHRPPRRPSIRRSGGPPRRRQRHPLPHPRQGGRLQPGRRGQTEVGEQRPGARGVGALAAQALAQQHVVLGVEPGQQQVLLRHEGDTGGDRAPVGGRDPALRIARDQPRDQPQQRRLADAARPQQAGPAAALQEQVEPVEEGGAIEGHAARSRRMSVQVQQRTPLPSPA